MEDSEVKHAFKEVAAQLQKIARVVDQLCNQLGLEYSEDCKKLVSKDNLEDFRKQNETT